MTDKAKKRVREVQDLTGWKYQFCAFLCHNLGQDVVLEALAAERPGNEDGDASLKEVAAALNARAKNAQRKKEARP